MQEEHSQDSPHSARSFHAPVPSTPLPPANSKSEWQQFKEDVCSILQATAKGNSDRQLQAVTIIIVSFVAERFGDIETGNN